MTEKNDEEVEVNAEPLTPLTKVQRRILQEMKVEDWSPSLAAIAGRTGISPSTLHYNWRQLQKKLDVEITIDIKPKQ